MAKSPTFTQWQAARDSAFKGRFVKACKARKMGLFSTLVNDFLKSHFARFLVVDAFGTSKLCWSLEEAYKWLPYCANDGARIVDTIDFSTVASRAIV